MSSAKGPGPVGGAPPPTPPEGPGAPDAAGPAQPAQSPAGAESIDGAAALRIFEAVARRLQGGDIADRPAAARAAVAEVLGEQRPDLEATVRFELADRIATQIEEHPALSARLARLLDPPDQP